jgi:hypothetical protein
MNRWTKFAKAPTFQLTRCSHFVLMVAAVVGVQTFEKSEDETEALIEAEVDEAIATGGRRCAIPTGFARG